MRSPKKRICKSRWLSLDYFLKYDREFQRNKSYRLRNATEVILESDVIEKSFKEFKIEIYSEPDHTEEAIRIFIWNLVRKIQDDHGLGMCAERIDRTNVAVLNKFPVITGRKQRYSEMLAKSNYEDLFKFLSQEFFGDGNRPSECMEDFLTLLRSEDSLAHTYLISRHYAILSDRSRISFVTNLVAFPCSMPHQLRVRFFAVLDEVEVGSDWRNSIENVDGFLNEMVGSLPYETDCPATKSYWLLKFQRHCHHHVGIEKRPMFRQTDKYRAWLKAYRRREQREIDGLVRGCCTNAKEDPNLKQGELVRILLARFPMYLTDLQRGLYTAKLRKIGKPKRKGLLTLKKKVLDEDNLLKYFCVNPWDRLRC